jgi:hypothetical protein
MHLNNISPTDKNSPMEAPGRKSTLHLDVYGMTQATAIWKDSFLNCLASQFGAWCV